MANEFIARNGLIAQNNSTVTGSLTVTNGITGSLFGTASWSQTSSYVLNAVSSSFSQTASYVNTLTQNLTLNGNLTINGTASINYLNVQFESASIIYSSGSNQLGDDTSDIQTLIGLVNVSGSLNVTGRATISDLTGSLFGTSSWAVSSSQALSSTTASYSLTTQAAGANNYVQINSNGLLGGSSRFTFDGSTVSINTGAVLSATGSLLGTASYALSTLVGGVTKNVQYNNNGVLTGAGYLNYDISNRSLANGFDVTASGQYSHAEGQGTKALGYGSHTEGYYAQALDIYAHAEGNNTIASASYSHAEGNNTIASGSGAHSEGSGTIAIGAESHAEGQGTISIGIRSHAEGYLTTTIGEHSHSEGIGTQAVANYSHAEGNSTLATGVGSHAEGVSTQTTGNSSHAEGSVTHAVADYSHAEGSGTMTTGANSHAEGVSTTTIGNGAHAEGASTYAVSDQSHSEGSNTYAGWKGFPVNTITAGTASIAGGDYTYIFSAGSVFTDVGQLTYNSSSFDGSDTYIYLNNTAAVPNFIADSQYIIEAAASYLGGAYSHAEGVATKAVGEASHAEGAYTTAFGIYSHAEGTTTLANGNSSHAEGNTTTAFGDGAHAEGNSTKAISDDSHAEGLSTQSGWKGFRLSGVSLGTASFNDPGDYTLYFPAPGTVMTDSQVLYTFNSSSYDGTYTYVYLDDTAASFSYLAEITDLENELAPTRFGNCSHAEGRSTKALGANSHAEGISTITYASYSHAEGNTTKAIGLSSHAEGNTTTAIGAYSHAEGSDTIAAAIGSHAEGQGTIASGAYQHVSGQYNAHGDSTSLFIIGNGSNDSNRSDIFKVTTTDVQITGSLSISGSSVYYTTSTFTVANYDGTANIILAGNNGTELKDGNNKLGLKVRNANRELYDLTASQSIDWHTRRLIKSDGTTITADWEAGTFTGSLYGTASWSNNATTASYALNGGVTQIIAGTNVTISPANGLGAVTINSTATGGGSGTNTTSSFSSATTWTFIHGLNSRYVVIQTLDSSHNQIIPQNIELTDANTATITFPSPETGYAIASLGGIGTTAATASYVTPYETAWSSYTPVWSSSGTQPILGNGTLTGAYKQIGKTVFIKARLAFGTTTSGGTGAWYFSMPVTASDAAGIQFPCSLLDNGNAWYQATVNGEYGGFTYKTALIGQSAGGANSSQGIDANFPFIWGSGDSLQFNGTYESV